MAKRVMLDVPLWRCAEPAIAFGMPFYDFVALRPFFEFMQMRTSIGGYIQKMERREYSDEAPSLQAHLSRTPLSHFPQTFSLAAPFFLCWRGRYSAIITSSGSVFAAATWSIRGSLELPGALPKGAEAR